MIVWGSESGVANVGDQRDIVFSDVVFNLFAIFLIFLLIFPLALSVSEADAPTRNREEPEFLTIRDCYVDALRPVSLFIQYGKREMQIIDYESIARSLAAFGNDVRIESGSASLKILDDGGDVNSFALTFSPFPEPFYLGDSPVDNRNSRLQTDLKLLDQEVYGRGYVPFFEVPDTQLGSFSALFTSLLESGRRFRWRLREDAPSARFRNANTFRSASFCR